MYLLNKCEDQSSPEPVEMQGGHHNHLQFQCSEGREVDCQNKEPGD